MVEYISKQAAVDAGYLSDWYISSVGDEPPVWTDAHIDELLNDFIVIPKDTKSADVQSVDKITKIIQARLNGVQKVKIDAMLSGDSNTAYKMVGAETVCIAILQDLEAIKG